MTVHSPETTMDSDTSEKAIQRRAEKRFLFTATGSSNQWRCADRLTGAVGAADSPKGAYDDCMLDLEMMTSDIHK
jgi:hypothetical protein